MRSLESLFKSPIPWVGAIALTLFAYGMLFTPYGSGSLDLLTKNPSGYPLPYTTYDKIQPNFSKAILFLWLHRMSYHYPVWVLHHEGGTSVFYWKDAANGSSSVNVRAETKRLSFFIWSAPFFLVWYVTFFLTNAVIRLASWKMTAFLASRWPSRWWVLWGKV